MTKKLIEKGSALANELEDKASEYHVKSSVNEKFSWEAVGIRTCVSHLVEGNNSARKDTRYIDIEWGKELRKYSHQLSEKVRSFYKEYYGN